MGPSNQVTNNDTVTIVARALGNKRSTAGRDSNDGDRSGWGWSNILATESTIGRDGSFNMVDSNNMEQSSNGSMELHRTIDPIDMPPGSHRSRKGLALTEVRWAIVERLVGTIVTTSTLE